MLSPRFRFLLRLVQHMVRILIRAYVDLTFSFFNLSEVYDFFQLLCVLGQLRTAQKISERLSENHQEPFALGQKMQLGYKRCKKYLKYFLKQTEKWNEKRGSVSYAARTAKCSSLQDQPSVRGVYVPLGRVIP